MARKIRTGSKLSVARGVGRRKTQRVERDETVTAEELARFATSMDKVKACRKHSRRKPVFRRAFTVSGTRVLKFYGLCQECASNVDPPKMRFGRRPMMARKAAKVSTR